MEKFFAAVQNMFKVPELRKRILFTLGTAGGLSFRRACSPLRESIRLSSNRSGAKSAERCSAFSIFSPAETFRTISVFALGVTPYITASIIIQLMTVLSPAAEKNSGRRRSRTAENQSVDALSDSRFVRGSDIFRRDLASAATRLSAKAGGRLR